ncbi:hypothetical protein A4W92_04010 [Pseudomonas aeruginosa]|uniref:hypothetical protein n=1 Tax=Pseudomonas aeruginosa TaxID=287 RepID=UPI0007A953A9|nr:hypothetical protein A4W92_04010 [Pseudomonas aeruginosa]
MTAESPTIRLERYSERHVEGLTALYNDPAVARQVLQMPYQSVEQRRKRAMLYTSTKRPSRTA